MIKFFDEDDLIDRLIHAYRENEKNVVFIVGSPLVAPSGESKGVSDVVQIVNLIRAEFANDKNSSSKLDGELASTSQQPYQSAFEFLLGRRGPAKANQIIRRAVLSARSQPGDFCSDKISDEKMLQDLEGDNDGWALSPGVRALGIICNRHKKTFGNYVLTTNFDPLIEISVKSDGGDVFRSVTHSDGNISQAAGTGVHVVHLHGYWRGSDTLHTPAQLTQPRPQLKNSLSALVKNSLVVVVAYGGWDDVITDALSSAVSDDTSYPEIAWTFYSDSSQDIEARNDTLIEKLQPGISRGRVSMYKGINCHQFFPSLKDGLEAVDAEATHAVPGSPKVTVVLSGNDEILASIVDNRNSSVIDAFPKNESWFGRDTEIRALTNSHASIISISGMGGQGKSALASTFMQQIKDCSDERVLIDWRDCREQTSTIHLALAGATARATNGQCSSDELAKLPFNELVTMFVNKLSSIKGVFVFDNIDQYVDLESAQPLDQIKILVEAVLVISTRSKIIFTSRPRINIEHTNFQEMQLSGLSGEASKDLFEKKALLKINDAELGELFELTQGHPLWISFIASQCSATEKQPLAQFTEIRAGKGDLPENTMRATWRALSSKGQELLRVLAELERPEEIANLDGLGGLRWNQLIKGFNNLDKMSLIVHKQQEDGKELVDLHPLVRSFVRREFAKQDRQSFINLAITYIQGRLDRFSKLSGLEISFEVLDIWLHKVELLINHQDYQGAIETLRQVRGQLQARGLHEEMVRLSKRVLQEIDWSLSVVSLNQFDDFIASAIHMIVGLEGGEVAEKLLSKYEAAISGKGAHYINLCEIRAYVNWYEGKYLDAIHWAEHGVELKKDYDVESPHDCAHTLALAKRDSGNPSAALEYFLYGVSLEECLNENIDPQRGGEYYGNVGRCLQMMGRLQEALFAYKKVAKLFEKNNADALNQAYIRTWVAEIMQDLGRVEDALYFNIAAARKWDSVSPGKAAIIQARIEELATENSGLQALLGTPVWKTEHRFIEWSKGKV